MTPTIAISQKCGLPVIVSIALHARRSAEGHTTAHFIAARKAMSGRARNSRRFKPVGFMNRRSRRHFLSQVNSCRRYQHGGLESALFEKQRPCAAAVLNDSDKQRIIAMVCSNPPEGRARWTVRLVAEETVKRRLVPRVGRETVRILLLDHDLKPWREKMWCVAELNEEYISKMEDVVETYEKPYNPAEPVVCLDEKPITLHADVRPTSPAKPGREARRDNEYERRGTANVFCAVEPKAGHFTFPTPDRWAFQFARVACEAMQYIDAVTVHLVLDNHNIHCLKSLIDTFGTEMGREVWNRFTIHSTPKHGSWLNQAEIEIGLFARQCLGRRRIPDLLSLRKKVGHGTVEWTGTRSRLTGTSIAALPDASSAINATL
jgi:hypothetical protein